MAKSDGTGYWAGLAPELKEILQIVLLYAAFAVPWLVGSDWLVGHFFHDSAWVRALDVGSDISMVAITSVLLAWILSRYCRKTTESLRQLQQSEEEFRVMFESASVGMGQANPYTRQVLRVNRKLEEITGYTAEELTKLTVSDFTHPEDLQRDAALSKRLVEGELPALHLEKRYVRKDGGVVWVSANTNLIRDAAGNPLRTVATVEDISGRRRGEEERMLLTTALEQTAESVAITDVRGNIVYVNPAFERISGYTRSECLGQNSRILQSGRHDATFYRQLWATITGGNVWRGRFLNKRKDGTLFEEEATISPILDGSGKVINYMAIKLDISRQTELENQFRQAQKLEAIGLLAGGVAHDFNNILTSILMQVELGSMDDSIPDGAREGFSQIQKDAERAAGLTRQLLLFSRRQVMQSQDINLNDVVTNLAKMLQRIIGEDVRLQLNLHPACAMTHADAGMIEQVILNLAVNARDAMPDGGRLVIETSEATLNAEALRGSADVTPGPFVCLSVTDTGGGIPANVMPRIFEPFFTTKAAGKGTGLGLATVFGIVKQHRGWITVDSEIGRGSAFKVFLPAIAKKQVKDGTEVHGKPPGGCETVLLAEDEAMVRFSIKTILARNGYRVLEAANGEEALSKWAENRHLVSLLFTDLVMPNGMSGQQLARQLQSEKPALKVLYTSGYSAEMAGREIELKTGENFMQKPISPDVLLRTVRSCLDQQVLRGNRG